MPAAPVSGPRLKPRRNDTAGQAENTICLWYNGDAEDAARSYAKTFPDSSVDAAHRAGGLSVGEETMTEAQAINRLLASKEYAALQRLRPEFNLFSLLDDALREPAWSRLFSGLLDSTLPHGLGAGAFRGWLAEVADELGRRGRQLPSFFQAVPPDAIVRSTVEYSTPKKRRIDILVRVLDATHRVVGVVGVENKLGSPEQPSQVGDYQAALTEVFPGAHRLIVYLTPDGREARTANPSAQCPYLPTSYRTMVRLCRALRTGAEPEVGLLLDSLCSEIENAVLGDGKMEREAKELIRKLWSDADHRKAMQLIIECVPTPRKLWETELLHRVEEPLKACSLELEEDTPIQFYPNSSERPNEVKFGCGGKVGEATAKAGFWLIYMLHCRERNPDIGGEFVLRLMAWCYSEPGRQRVKEMKLGDELPAGGVQKHWSSWENIWTGGSYTLRDFDALDLAGMANLLLDGVRQTWPAVRKRVAKLGK